MAQGEFLTACEQAVNTAAGRQLGEDEMQELVTRMESTVARIRAENQGLSLEEAALRAADEVARDDALAKHIEARNRVINLRLMHENLQRIDAFGGRPDLALSAIMVGRNEAVAGSRDSAFNNMRQLRDHYISGLANDLEAQGFYLFLLMVHWIRILLMLCGGWETTSMWGISRKMQSKLPACWRSGRKSPHRCKPCWRVDWQTARLYCPPVSRYP